MDWFSTLTLAFGSAWTSGINLYATVTILGVLQKFGLAKLPGGLDVLDNWWIIGVAAFLYAIEFFADKIPYVDSVWDFSGKAISGELSGKELKKITVLKDYWFDWKTYHTDTQLYNLGSR